MLFMIFPLCVSVPLWFISFYHRDTEAQRFLGLENHAFDAVFEHWYIKV